MVTKFLGSQNMYTRYSKFLMDGNQHSKKKKDKKLSSSALNAAQ